MNVIVIAKSPVPGLVKTRLCPPCSSAQAAAIAEAALTDTLATVARLPHVQRVLALDGEPGDWIPSGFEVVPQEGTTLNERLDAAFMRAGAPALLIGMDTPQVRTAHLVNAIRTLHDPGVDAILGDAFDGGWWITGFGRYVPGAFDDVLMSTPYTADLQRMRFRQLGLRCAPVPPLQDVDTFPDALRVATSIPESRFATRVREVRSRQLAERRGLRRPRHIESELMALSDETVRR
jgi:uncharacterized protein